MSLRPYAEAFEARFLQIEAALVRAGGYLVYLPERSGAVLPTGREPTGGARFAGHVEQAFGGSLAVLFHMWCVDQNASQASKLFDDPATCERFCHVLVDRALGIAAAPVGRGPEEGGREHSFGTIEGFVWHSDTARPGPMHLLEFAEGAARAMFADAWAMTTSENLQGMDIMDAAPATPPDAILEGYRLAGRYEAANGRSIDDLMHAAHMADCGGDPAVHLAKSDEVGGLADAEEFGIYLALQSMGHGSGWFDRHAEFPLERPSFEYDGPNGCEPDPADEPEEVVAPVPRL